MCADVINPPHVNTRCKLGLGRSIRFTNSATQCVQMRKKIEENQVFFKFCMNDNAALLLLRKIKA